MNSRLFLIGSVLLAAFCAEARVECRSIQLKGAQVLDNTFEMNIDVKILSFQLFPDYISTIMWPQDTKQMDIVFAKQDFGLISESRARMSEVGDYLNSMVHVDSDGSIQIICSKNKF